MPTGLRPVQGGELAWLHRPTVVPRAIRIPARQQDTRQAEGHTISTRGPRTRAPWGTALRPSAHLDAIAELNIGL